MNTFKKPIKIIIVLLGICVLGVITFVVFFKKQQTEPILQESGQVTHSEQEEEHFLYNSETDTYTLTVDLEMTGNTIRDTRIKKEVMKEVGVFETDFAPNTFSPEEMEFSFSNGRQWKGTWTGYVASEYNGFLSYRVDGYSYTGGAHGNSFSWTYVFDTAGEKVELVNLFKKGVNYESLLSTLSRKILLRDYVDISSTCATEKEGNRTDEEYCFNVGTEPNANNFSRFLVYEEGLTLIFPPYQIAPYSAGSFEIIIPWEELEQDLNKDYYKIKIIEVELPTS